MLAACFRVALSSMLPALLESLPLFLPFNGVPSPIRKSDLNSDGGRADFR